MLINMDITIAYKCFSCGTFDFVEVNLFKLLLHKKISWSCKCGASELHIEKSEKNEFRLTVPCMGCGSEHQYPISRGALLSNHVNIYTCSIYGIKNCIIGKDYSVRKFIDDFEKELDGIIDGLGYDNYFENTQVMMDILNKIHDIAEMGNLRCECGSKDIILSMHRGGIILRCVKCFRVKYIPASTNMDLKKVLQRDGITLFSRKFKAKISAKK